MVIPGTVVLGGEGSGQLVWTPNPLSFWGGVDPEAGMVVDQHHPLAGQEIGGKVLAIPHTRGSSTSSGVLLEMIRRGTAPTVIITQQLDPILTLGALIGGKIYGRRPVVVTISPEDFQQLASETFAAVDMAGRVTTWGESEKEREDR